MLDLDQEGYHVQLTELDLSENEICGVNAFGIGKYTKEGLAAILEAATRCRTLTSLSLAENQICGISPQGSGVSRADGISAIADALRVRSNLGRLNLRGNRLNAACSSLIAQGLRRAPSLTSLCLAGCNLSSSSGKAIIDALNENQSLTFVSTANNKLGPISKSIAAALLDNSKANMGEANLRKALESGMAMHGLSVLSLKTPAPPMLPPLPAPRGKPGSAPTAEKKSRPRSHDAIANANADPGPMASSASATFLTTLPPNA